MEFKKGNYYKLKREILEGISKNKDSIYSSSGGRAFNSGMLAGLKAGIPLMVLSVKTDASVTYTHSIEFKGISGSWGYHVDDFEDVKNLDFLTELQRQARKYDKLLVIHLGEGKELVEINADEQSLKQARALLEPMMRDFKNGLGYRAFMNDFKEYPDTSHLTESVLKYSRYFKELLEKLGLSNVRCSNFYEGKGYVEDNNRNELSPNTLIFPTEISHDYVGSVTVDDDYVNQLKREFPELDLDNISGNVFNEFIDLHKGVLQYDLKNNVLAFNLINNLRVQDKFFVTNKVSIKIKDVGEDVLKNKGLLYFLSHHVNTKTIPFIEKVFADFGSYELRKNVTTGLKNGLMDKITSSVKDFEGKISEYGNFFKDYEANIKALYDKQEGLVRKQMSNDFKKTFDSLKQNYETKITDLNRKLVSTLQIPSWFSLALFNSGWSLAYDKDAVVFVLVSPSFKFKINKFRKSDEPLGGVLPDELVTEHDCVLFLTINKDGRTIAYYSLRKNLPSEEYPVKTLPHVDYGDICKGDAGNDLAAVLNTENIVNDLSNRLKIMVGLLESINVGSLLVSDEDELGNTLFKAVEYAKKNSGGLYEGWGDDEDE